MNKREHRKSSDTSGASSPCPAIDFKSKAILIVNDHPAVGSSLRAVMESRGAETINLAASASEALRHVQSDVYDIIICDYDLGDNQNGQHLLKSLRLKRLIGMSTVFLMVTANRRHENAAATVDFTPDDYLIKPFTAHSLIVRIERALTKKHVFGKVFALMDQGDISGAASACDDLIAHSKGKHIMDALRLKAEFSLVLGKYTEAQSIYEKIFSYRTIPWAAMGAARSMILRGKYAEAEPVLSNLIKNHPGHLKAYGLLAQVQSILNKPAEAREVLATKWAWQRAR